MERLTLGRMQNPIRGFLHGGAALACIAGLIVLLIRSRGSGPALVGSLVFSLALLVMFVVSSLYHSIPWSPAWKARLQRVDHSMIYLVVAGTFTPIAIASLHGATLAVALTVLWVMASVGIVLKAILSSVTTRLSVILQLLMGWVALVWAPQIVERLGWAAIGLIAAGGVCYTAGAVIFITKRPRLFPRSFSYHELFHVLVIAGSGLHFLAIMLYAIPATTGV